MTGFLKDTPAIFTDKSAMKRPSYYNTICFESNTGPSLQTCPKYSCPSITIRQAQT